MRHTKDSINIRCFRTLSFRVIKVIESSSKLTLTYDIVGLVM